MNNSAVKYRGWLVGIVLFSTGFGLLSFGGTEGGSGGRPIFWLTILLFLTFHQSKVGWTRIKTLALLPLAAISVYVLISASWSFVPGTTFRRSILLIVVIAIAAIIASERRIGEDRFTWMIVWPLGLFCVFSIIFSITFPTQGVTDIGWRGIASHKNELGQISAVGALLMLTMCLMSKRESILVRLLILSSCIVSLYFSRSSSSQGAFLAAALFYLFATTAVFVIGDKRYWIAAISVAMFVVVSVLFGVTFGLLPGVDAYAELLLSTFGKSSTLTGRTDLWYLVLKNRVYVNELLGSGYGGFWNGVNSASGYIASQFGGGYVGQAHNGYLDVYNDLGWIGIGLVVVYLLFWMVGAISSRNLSPRQKIMHLSLLVFVVVINITESTLMRTTQLINILAIIAYFRVWTEAVESDVKND